MFLLISERETFLLSTKCILLLDMLRDNFIVLIGILIISRYKLGEKNVKSFDLRGADYRTINVNFGTHSVFFSCFFEFLRTFWLPHLANDGAGQENGMVSS